MSLSNSQLMDQYQFASLGELKEWLDGFKSTDLDVVWVEGADYINLEWFEETLSDGSAA